MTSEQIIEQISLICSEYQEYCSGFHTKEDLTPDDIQHISTLLNLSEDTEILGFTIIGIAFSEKIIKAKYGAAICDNGIFWKNEPHIAPQFGVLPYSELPDITIQKISMSDITLGDGRKIGSPQVMDKKVFAALFTELQSFVIEHKDEFDYGEDEHENEDNSAAAIITSNVRESLHSGVLAKETAFYSVYSPSGEETKRLNNSLAYLRRDINAENIDNFMRWFQGEIDVFDGDEFPVFGYAADIAGSGKKGWICTNKRIYRNDGVFGKSPVIELSKIKEFNAEESSGKMVFSFGLFKSDSIKIPYKENGIFSSKFSDLFNELVSIFQYLVSENT